MKTIPYGRQQIDDADVAAVIDVLRSDFLTQGPAVPRFEAALAARVGAARGVAVNSATSALHVACLALGLGPGKLLWTAPNTFVASANAARLCGADVDFVDVDPATGLMDPDALAAKLAAAPRAPDVVMPVHMCGQSCDMAAIRGLAQAHGFRVIEDASHAVGGRDADGAMVGACAHADVAVFSFHPVKIVTTAEGGMAMTQDQALADHMARLRSHGITRDPAEMTHAPDGPWYYQQIELGLNYRMTELQAALGLSQLDRLDAFVARRNALADRYDALLGDLPVARPGRRPGVLSAFHLYVVRVDPARRRAVFEGLRARGIGVQVHYIPVHTQPYYQALGFRPGDFPGAEAWYAAAISLPLFPDLTEADQDAVVAALKAELSA